MRGRSVVDLEKIPAPAVVPGWWQDARRLSITTIKSPTGPRFLLDFRSYCTSWVRTTKKGKKMVVCGAKNLHGFSISNAQPRLPLFPSRPPKLVLVRAIMGTGGHFGVYPPQGRKRTVACTKPAFGVALPSQNTIMFTYFVPSLRLCVNLPGGTLVPGPSPFLRSHPCR